jgi:hypothetical protein
MPERTKEAVNLALAGRKDDLRLVMDACQALFDPVQATPNPCLLFYSGWRGMGKSRFLRELALQPKPDNLITVMVVTDPNPEVWLELDRFFKAFASQLNEHFLLENYNRLIGNRSLRLDQDGLSLRANTMTNDLLRLQKSKGSVILLLHDQVSSKAFQWLGKFFYKKLFDASALCVVATGATSPTISSLSLLPYFYTANLRALIPDEAVRIIAGFGFDEQIQANLIKFSAGNPGCLNEGVYRLNQNYEGSLALAMADYLLEGLSESIAQPTLYLAPLRYFNHDLMSVLLPEVLPPDSPVRNYGAADFLRLGRELNDKVDFIETGQNYFMQSAARQILTYALAYHDADENVLGQIHQKAADYYRDLLARLKPEQRPAGALEHVYHTVQFNLSTNSLAEFSLKSFDYLLGEAALVNELAVLVRQEPDLSPYFRGQGSEVRG